MIDKATEVVAAIILVLLIILGISAIAIVVSGDAMAHEDYNGYENLYGQNCCNNKDCKPWPAEDIKDHGDGTYTILSLGYTFDRNKILTTPPKMMKRSLFHACCLPLGAAFDRPAKPQYTRRCLFVPPPGY